MKMAITITTTILVMLITMTIMMKIRMHIMMKIRLMMVIMISGIRVILLTLSLLYGSNPRPTISIHLTASLSQSRRPVTTFFMFLCMHVCLFFCLHLRWFIQVAQFLLYSIITFMNNFLVISYLQMLCFYFYFLEIFILTYFTSSTLFTPQQVCIFLPLINLFMKISGSFFVFFFFSYKSIFTKDVWRGL